MEKGRILFVDDDRGALDQVRQQVSLLGDRWEAEFHDSAAGGLRACSIQPFNVVVADLDMPGMSGTEFLQEILARHPATFRVLLAEPSQQERALQGLGRTHQFLIKPCNIEFLKTIADSTREFGHRVGNDHVRELIARIGQLPAVPDLYREISALLESDRGSAERLGAVIAKDMAMTAMILKLANSAFFSFRQQVSSVSEAVSLLGADLLKALVLAHGLFGQVGAFRVGSFTVHNLWEHSLAVGAAARHLAVAEGRTGQANDFFTAGLLHDLGILILASRFPEDYVKVLETNRLHGGDLEDAERHVFGVTHAEVGAYLLALWGIPEPVVQAAACHHGIAAQPVRDFTPALAVHVADIHYALRPVHEVFSRARLDEAYLASLGLADRLRVWFAAMDSAGNRHPS